MDVDVAIVGAGPAGISAAIWAHTLKLRYAVLEAAREPGGQLLRVHNRVLDYAGLPSENGAALAERICAHAEMLGVTILPSATVSAVDVERGLIRIGESTVTSRHVVLATGVRARTLGIPGEAVFVGRGVSPSASRFAEQFRGCRVIVVGGGDAAFEEALILSEVCEHVTLIHRSDRYSARRDFRDRVDGDPRIDVVPFAELIAIEGVDRVERVRVRLDDTLASLDVAGVFVCVGVEPNSELVAGQVELDHRGYVVVDSRMRTSTDRLYAVGDVRSGSSLTIAAAVGEGATAVKDIQRQAAEAANHD
ncbi:MAG: NAD(P)/FAD-dependent oxidoreductase [Blastocatellia bacterium]|nr:NAD(P)/FAD-dependent oxidoreductase [Blastocatellia bacterium]